MYEKIYSPNNKYSEEFSIIEWDSNNRINKYYKKVPIEITEEEYQEVKQYLKCDDSVCINNPKNNPIASILRVIATLIYVAGLIVGCYLSDNLAIAIGCWIGSFFSGTLILWFAEVIRLLNDIKNK